MEVNVTVTVTEDDIQRGFTAADVVRFAFPNSDYGQTYKEMVGSQPVLEQEYVREEPTITDEEAEQLFAESEGVISPEARAILDTPEPVQDNVVSINNEQEEFLDSSGVPWSKTIHSSNKKKYASGADAGRWMWKRGTDPVEREEVARGLAAEVFSSPVVDASPAETGVGDTAVPGSTAPGSPAPVQAPVVGIPTPENAAPAVAVPGVVTPPVPENSGAELPQTETPAPSEGGITWPDFVKAVTANAISTDKLNEALAANDLDQMALLSPGQGPMDNPSRIAVATRLGFI